MVDHVSVSQIGQNLSRTLGVSPEQIGLKAGMLTCAVFPLIGCVLLIFIIRYFKQDPIRSAHTVK